MSDVCKWCYQSILPQCFYAWPPNSCFFVCLFLSFFLSFFFLFFSSRGLVGVERVDSVHSDMWKRSSIPEKELFQPGTPIWRKGMQRPSGESGFMPDKCSLPQLVTFLIKMIAKQIVYFWTHGVLKWDVVIVQNWLMKLWNSVIKEKLLFY